MKKSRNKPRILLIADVPNWAWHYKCEQLANHLSREFHFEVKYRYQESKLNRKIVDKFDLFFTFAPRYVDMLERIKVPIERRITGVTANYLGIEDDLLKYRQQVKWFHANSVQLVKVVGRYYPNTFYLPNGVDPDIFRPLPLLRQDIGNPCAFTVGHVGKDTPRKGFHRIILPAFNDAYGNGCGMVLKANLRRYRDALTQAEMVQWYQDVDLMVFASDLDGTPNPMLEAAACSIPSIINPIGNAPEFIKDGVNGFLTEKGVTNYAELITWCRENPHICREMGWKARKTVLDGWTWRTQAENYKDMFKTILGVL